MDSIRSYWPQALLILCLGVSAGQAIGTGKLRMGEGSQADCPNDAVPKRKLELHTERHHWIWLSCSKTKEI